MISLIVLCGPTASGKSSLALKLAQQFNSVILSADSRQVYRGFDIGTAKPTLEEQQLVPHYLIDICEPTQTLTVGDYQDQANGLLAKFAAQQQPSAPIFLVGGTGLYIKAITQGLKIPRVPPQPELRSQLTTLGQAYSYQLLRQVDPLASQRIHANDTVRTIRALEVFYVTGLPISSQQGEAPPQYPILQIGLDCGERLGDRIQQRTAAMLAQGFVAEVRALQDRYGADLPLLATLGYQEIQAYLSGQLTLSEAEQQIVLHTRQFAKRQRTWFRAIPTIHWFDSDASDLVDQVLLCIKAL